MDCHLISKFVDFVTRANINRVSKGLTTIIFDAPEKRNYVNGKKVTVNRSKNLLIVSLRLFGNLLLSPLKILD
jgi:hypothetical protein